VLEIHGGPHGQYGVGFFHEMQLLAAQGYVVVFSNPRGSKGYGEDFCAAIKGTWGRKDWEDMQAVIAWMSGLPDVDASRLGVMGGSYGGYMTNWIVGHTGAFRAAITDRCVSNLVSMFGSSDIAEEPGNYWTGNCWDDAAELWDQSPLKHLGNCTTPTLIIHSEGDLRCNVEQAEQVYMALKHLGVPTRLVRYPRSTSHGMSRAGPPDMRLHRLGQILGWWKRWLG
jgi:acylaminoacyl-peptidase